jgi:hypothetical protein
MSAAMTPSAVGDRQILPRQTKQILMGSVALTAAVSREVAPTR